MKYLKLFVKSPYTIIVGLSLFLSGFSEACTDIILPYENPYVSGRTMDFHGVLNARVVKIPANHAFTSKAPGVDAGTEQDGKNWIGKYGFIAINYHDLDLYSDGMNTEGLSVGLLWLEETKYPQPIPEDASKSVTITDSVAYLLSTSATVADVIKYLDEVIIWGNVVPELGDSASGLHIIAHDSDGNTLLVEFINQKPVLYQYQSSAGKDRWISGNDVDMGLPTGVLTNSPPYNRQQKRYYKYRLNRPTKIPGETDSIARFQRASILRSLIPKELPAMHLRASNPASVDQQRIQFMVQLLNRLEITEMEYLNKPVDAYTIWSIVRDHTNKVFYWFNNMNHTLRGIELDKLDFNDGQDDEVNLNAGDWSNSLTVTLSR
jgi:penicillin V acylase-like amidase (Ntn superfamily)